MESGRDYSKGIAAGFAATIVLSALIVMKARMGLMPQLDPVQMLGDMIGNGSRPAGWVMHFMIGTVAWGLLFTLLFGAVTDGLWWRGIVFAIGAWLLMMIAVMPMAGAGFFGLGLGILAPVLTLMLHVIYGFVLGVTYGAMLRAQPATA